MKLVSVVGARPQFVKAAVISRRLREIPDVAETLVHTGQHYDENLSDVFFEELEMERPEVNLGIGSAPHGAQTGRMLAALESVLVDRAPDRVLVYGDTNSTLAGALAAAKLNIPVAHVEAGLRSFNRRMPEEINRIVTDHCSDLLFAPTQTALGNLRTEGVPANRIHLVGDVMYDAALFYTAKAESSSTMVRDLGLTSRSYILATVHRAENTDDPRRLGAVVEGLSAVAERVPVVLPLHPRTSAALRRLPNQNLCPSLRIIEPVGYLDMMVLEKHAAVIATDSGGVQKEAFFFRVPCVTLREETEWVELVRMGWNRVTVPYDAKTVRDAVLEAYHGLVPALSEEDSVIYGVGQAAEAICERLAQ